MAYLDDFAIVDAAKGGASEGKILVLLDDEVTAQEIAVELGHRGCQVVVQAVQYRGTSARRRPAATNDAPSSPPVAAVAG